MKIKRYVRSYLFIIVTALLVVSIGVSAFAFAMVSKKDKQVREANAQILTTTEELEQTKNQLTKEQADKAKISEELATAQQSNQELWQQNEAYKAEIEKLSANKKVGASQTVQQETTSQPEYPKVYPPATKVCYLTFDDGPSDNTLKILDILANYGAKATFFVVGSSKLQYLPNIKAGGHAIGAHANSHSYSSIYSSTTNFFVDYEYLQQKIEAQIGSRTLIMRFPGGSNNTVSKKYCHGIMTELAKQVQDSGYRYFDWNVDSGDASGNNVAKSRIVNNVLNQARNKNAICVLMHDTDAKDTTVAALPEIIEGLKMQGYSFEALTTESYGFHFVVNN